MDLMNLSELKKSSDNPSACLLDIKSLSPSIYLVSLLLNPFNESEGLLKLAGKYLKFDTPVGTRNYSIDNVAKHEHGGVVNLIIGGSSLNSVDIEFLDFCKYCLLKHEGNMVNTKIEITGKCYLRRTAVHDKLFIAAGTGFSFIKPLLVSMVQFYQSLKNDDKGDFIGSRKVECIWANKSIYNIYSQSNYEDLVKSDLPELDYSHKLLIEKSFEYQDEYFQLLSNNGLSLEISTLINYLEKIFIPEKLKSGLNLSNTIIYIGGSKDTYNSVSKLLIEKLNANPSLIVCDHH